MPAATLGYGRPATAIPAVPAMRWKWSRPVVEPPPPDATCDDITCPEGQVCREIDDVPTCVDQTCADLDCPEGTICLSIGGTPTCVSVCTAPCTELNAQGECVSTYPPRPSLNHFQIPATCGWYDNCTQNPNGTTRTPPYGYVSAARLAASGRLRRAGVSVGDCLPLGYINAPESPDAADCARAGGTWRPDPALPGGGECTFPPPVVVPEPGPCQTVNLVDINATPPEYEVISLCLSDEICVNDECRPRPVQPGDPDDPPPDVPLQCPPGTTLSDNGLFCRELTPEERPCVGFDVTVDINNTARQLELRDTPLSIVSRDCGENTEPIVFSAPSQAEIREQSLQLIQPGVAAQLAGFANSAARWLGANA